MAAPVGAGGVVSYSFGVGPLGITVHEVRGGTRIAIESVHPDSQAAALGVPEGGLLMSVGAHKATGVRLAAVGKMLANSERPLTIMVLQDADSQAKVVVEPVVTQQAAGPTRESLLEMGLEIKAYEFGPGTLGLALEEDHSAGTMLVSEVSPDSPAAEQGVAVGSTLVALNQTEVLGMSKSQAIALLGRAKRPMTLHLASQPPPPPMLLEYIFGSGSMGLSLGDSPGGVIIEDVAKGSTAATLGVQPGGIVAMLNMVPLAGMNKSQVVRLIGKSKRPLTLSITPGAPPSDAKDGSVAVSSGEAAAGESATDEEQKGKGRAHNREHMQRTQVDLRRVGEERRNLLLAKRISQRNERAEHQGAQGALKAKAAVVAAAAAAAAETEAGRAARINAIKRVNEKLANRRGGKGAGVAKQRKKGEGGPRP